MKMTFLNNLNKETPDIGELKLECIYNGSWNIINLNSINKCEKSSP